MSVLKSEPDVAQETIKLKQIMTRKRYESKENKFGEEASKDKKLIILRYLGHKFDIPGSGQWKIFDKHHQKCWICD